MTEVEQQLDDLRRQLFGPNVLVPRVYIEALRSLTGDAQARVGVKQTETARFSHGRSWKKLLRCWISRLKADQSAARFAGGRLVQLQRCGISSASYLLRQVSSSLRWRCWTT